MAIWNDIAELYAISFLGGNSLCFGLPLAETSADACGPIRSARTGGYLVVLVFEQQHHPFTILSTIRRGDV